MNFPLAAIYREQIADNLYLNYAYPFYQVLLQAKNRCRPSISAFPANQPQKNTEIAKASPSRRPSARGKESLP